MRPFPTVTKALCIPVILVACIGLTLFLSGVSPKSLLQDDGVIGTTEDPRPKQRLANGTSVKRSNAYVISDDKISSYIAALTKKPTKKDHIAPKSGLSWVTGIMRAKTRNSTSKRKCSNVWCKLPDCRCIGSDIPGGISRQEAPMMVMLTFDDSVNRINFPYYQQLFDGSLKNPNGCPVKGTFFVSGDSTQYDMVKELSKDGHEIASHTLSHRNPTTWWARAGIKNWEAEVMGMKNRLVEKANVPRDKIRGMRAPFLQIGGDDQFVMLHTNKFRFDSSMVTGSTWRDQRPPIWPFTLDTPPDTRTCNLTPCPTRSYPGLWEIPLVRWYGSSGVACAMPDGCSTGHGYKGTMAFLQDNFQRHYKSNKAPLGIFIHASWFKQKAENFEALRDFLASILQRRDVWLLTASQMLDWVQEPRPVSSLDSVHSWQCRR